MQLLLIGKPRGGSSQQEVAFRRLGKKVPIVSTYATGQKRFRHLSTKLCGRLRGAFGKESPIVITHFQRHIIHRRHLVKAGRAEAGRKCLWVAGRGQATVPLPESFATFENAQEWKAWSDLVADKPTSQPSFFDAALGERVAYVLPDGSITRDEKQAFLANYVRPLFEIYAGKVEGNAEAVDAAALLRRHFMDDVVIQHPRLTPFCVPEPWHFEVSEGCIRSLSGPRFPREVMQISELRASMFPCLQEPVIAMLYGLGVDPEVFCSS